MLRCKFKVAKVIPISDNKGGTESETITLWAVTGDCPENKTWSKWAPTGSMEFFVTNPAAMGKLKVGQEVYIDLSVVPVPAAS